MKNNCDRHVGHGSTMQWMVLGLFFKLLVWQFAKTKEISTAFCSCYHSKNHWIGKSFDIFNEKKLLMCRKSFSVDENLLLEHLSQAVTVLFPAEKTSW